MNTVRITLVVILNKYIQPLFSLVTKSALQNYYSFSTFFHRVQIHCVDQSYCFLALQALSKVVPSNGVYVSSIKFYFDIYTAPCYMMIILSVVNAVLLTFYYVEDVGGAKEKFKEEVKRLRRGTVLYVLLCTAS